MADVKKNKQKLKVVGYCRVSDIKQKEQGHSLETQKAIIKKYCNDKGFNLVKIFSEQISGSVECMKRPQFKILINDYLSKGKAEGLICPKFDRLSRDLKDMVNIISDYFKNKYKIFFCDNDTVDLNTPEGLLQMHMISSFSQFERTLIGKRTKQVLEYKKTKNEKTGGYVPYGYKMEVVKEGNKEIKKLVTNQEELDLIAELRQYRSDNNCTYKDLAQILIDRNIKNRDNKVNWTSKKVSIMCYPELYQKKNKFKKKL
jgi:DNA invertase Pin-like site-specific DNA recombinase